MATLRFTSEQSRVENTLPPAGGKVSVTLSLSRDHFTGLADELGKLEVEEGSELRTDFPSGWTLFWKIRDGESRFFVAHPEADEWVATLALSRTHMEKIQSRMRLGIPGALSSLERVSRMSNVEVSLGAFEESSP